MSKMTLVSIAGSGRSGSTLFSLLLAQDKNTFNLGQLRDFWGAYAQNHQCTCMQPLQQCSVWSSVVQAAFGSVWAPALGQMHQQMSAFRKDANALQDWTDATALAALASTHVHFLTKLNHFLKVVQQTSQSQVLVDSSKSPEIALAFSLLQGPTLRVINLVRDPRAVSASWQKKLGGEGGMQGATAWAHRQQRLMRWSQNLQKRFCVVRYEDFAKEPQKIVSQVTAWAGIAPTPALFSGPTTAQLSWDRQHLFPPSNETVLQERRTLVDIAAPNEWRNAANRPLHEQVERAMAPLMERFGYAPEFLAPRAPQTGTPQAARGAPTPQRQMVFLVCSERSGSNLISAMLRCHSLISAPPPYHLCRDVGANLHATLGHDTAAPAWKQLKDLLLTRVHQLKSPQAAQELAQWLSQRKQPDFKALADFVFCTLERASDQHLVFVKENEIHRMMFFILQAYPDAKFVFQVRDPRDFLVSAHGRKSGWFGNKFGSDRHALEIWRADQLGGLQALAHLGPQRVFLQRYEDLVSHPEQVLTALCRFLGVQFEAKMLDFHLSEEANKLAKPGGPRENLNKPLISDNFNKYRKSLSKRQIMMVETYVGDLMKRFAYTLDFPEHNTPSLARVFGPQLTEPIERYMNKDRTPFYPTGYEVSAPLGHLPLPYSLNAPADEQAAS